MKTSILTYFWMNIDAFITKGACRKLFTVFFRMHVLAFFVCVIAIWPMPASDFLSFFSSNFWIGMLMLLLMLLMLLIILLLNRLP
jgi:hypothetical protein